MSLSNSTLKLTLTKQLLIASICFFFSSVTHAHEVQGGGLLNGFWHPILGTDHLLAMVAVGALSIQAGGRAVWAVPSAFVAVMLLGGIWGIFGMPFFAIETGIALSVLVLGVAIAFDKKIPTLASMGFVGFFALFHGYAHGAEMPSLAEPALYALGFMVATAFLHICGIVVAEVFKRVKHGDNLLRYVGAGVAGIGFSILFGI